MGQLAPVIDWIKKNFFWLGCGFVTVATIATWFVASSSIQTDITAYHRTLKASAKKAKDLLQEVPLDRLDDTDFTPIHPNFSTEEGMKEELAKTVDSIIQGWQQRYDDQKAIFKWPDVIQNQGFTEFFGQYDPPETYPVPTWDFDPKIKPLLSLYRSKISEHMVYLCGDEILRAHWNYDPSEVTVAAVSAATGGGQRGGPPSGAGGGRGGAGPPGGGGRPDAGNQIDTNKYAVIWSSRNQEYWNKKMTSFQDRDDNRRPVNEPTPTQCYMLQQDLWLLEAAFKIVREVNGNSTSNDLSKIKQIDHIAFGRDVGGVLGELTEVDDRLANDTLAQVANATQGGPPSGPPETTRGGPGGAPGGGGDALIGHTSYHNRYVNKDLEPIDEEILRDIITGDVLPETNVELIVAKRVPFRIALKMDDRQIIAFKTACANSVFAFEINQFRINKHTSGGDEIEIAGGTGGGGGGGARGGGDRGAAGSGGDLSMGGVGGGTATAGPSISSSGVETRTNHDVNVEFTGIVKIYNPVRADFLRKATGIDTSEVDPNDAASNSSTDSNASAP